MGNTLSDWNGVSFDFTTSATYSTTYSADTVVVTLDPISMSNSIKTGGDEQIKDFAKDNSTFDGEIVWGYAVADTAPPNSCKVYIRRLIEQTE